jgi:hypothetical protein
MFQKLTGFFQGRHTLYIICAFVTGTGMCWFHRLDGNLVALLLGLGGFVLGHSIKEDICKDN